MVNHTQTNAVHLLRLTSQNHDSKEQYKPQRSLEIPKSKQKFRVGGKVANGASNKRRPQRNWWQRVTVHTNASFFKIKLKVFLDTLIQKLFFR